MELFLAKKMLTDEGERQDWALAIENTVIVDMGPQNRLVTNYPRAKTHDYRTHAIIPGLVNAHNHSFQSLIRGQGDDLGYYSWRNTVLFPLAEYLGRQEIEVGAFVTFAELLRHGVTTVADFFYPNGQSNENARAVIGVAEELGMRLVLARGMYDWVKAPALYREDVAVAERLTRALIEETIERPLITVHPAPHSLHGASPEMIRRGAAIARDYRVPFHLHFLEQPEDRDEILKTFGKSPLDYLDSLGALTDVRWLAIHAVWVAPSEMALMRATGTSVVHNPSSNLFLADGIAPIVDYVQQGIPVALGTDGACTNNRQSIFDEMRLASLLQKGVRRDAKVLPAATAFAMGTRWGAEALGLPVGVLARGKQADFIVLNLDDLSLVPPAPLENQCVYGLSPLAIEHVYVAGRRVVSGGHVEAPVLPSMVQDMMKISPRIKKGPIPARIEKEGG